MSTASKTFRAIDVASTATGIALAHGFSISVAHEISEHVVGHPVWTHEIPRFGARVEELLLAQFPGMPTRTQAEADWKAAAAIVASNYPETISVKRGADERTANPVDTLREMIGDKPIIAVTP